MATTARNQDRKVEDMKKEILVCDKCKKEGDAVHSFSVPYDTQPDVASGRTETMYKQIELCQDCAVTVLYKLLQWRLVGANESLKIGNVILENIKK